MGVLAQKYDTAKKRNKEREEKYLAIIRKQKGKIADLISKTFSDNLFHSLLLLQFLDVDNFFSSTDCPLMTQLMDERINFSVAVFL